MIISASRRTDIPNYYSDWFFNRIKEGYLYVRNPMNIHQISRISLSREVIDGIIFWTKNPSNMLNRIDEIDNYPYYFQFTLTSYGKDIEPNVPSKKDMIIPCFQTLSKQIGRERVVWRYDPILITKKYTVEYHIKFFKNLVEKLSDYTEKCTVSFLDSYKNIRSNMNKYGIIVPNESQRDEIIISFKEIALKAGIFVDTCSEKYNKFDVPHASCIDKKRIERIGNYSLNVSKDTGQRDACGCASSIDIGAYNTCKNGCVYCYANFSNKMVKNNSNKHNPNSPLLYGEVMENDVIIEKKMKSYIVTQTTLFN
ncbi:MAG: DUF1848 domain-containing protein [Eubacterium sp.]